MIEEVSAGGVVLFGNTILLLKKFNGDWVLPKGKVEEGEDISETALREVHEESGVKAEIVKYIGEVHYSYRSLKEEETVHKVVHWYLMETDKMESVPQKQEGFVEALFVHADKAAELAKYEAEKKVIQDALKYI
ncbi:MAG: NUDIX hydrolase [Tissierellia bacterium]|nr:NUDIX hydrolase [Tissierellia bacterium]